jgi:hypothetical protein
MECAFVGSTSCEKIAQAINKFISEKRRREAAKERKIYSAPLSICWGTRAMEEI